MSNLVLPLGDDSITSFSGEHRWLSNFWPWSVKLDGVEYPSVENAYQAAKTRREYRKEFVTCSPGYAKRLGRNVPIDPKWDSRKLNVMRDLIAQKYQPGSTLAEVLLATGDRLIIEGNTWGDTFWGVCNGKGSNHLGRLLMKQREHLRSLPST